MFFDLSIIPLIYFRWISFSEHNFFLKIECAIIFDHFFIYIWDSINEKAQNGWCLNEINLFRGFYFLALLVCISINDFTFKTFQSVIKWFMAWGKINEVKTVTRLINTGNFSFLVQELDLHLSVEQLTEKFLVILTW